MLLVESVYATYRETNSPLTFIPSLQHEAQTCRILCYRRLQRNGLLVAVALGRPTAIMVRCIPAVSVTFKRRWVLLLSLMCAVETEDDYTCPVSVLVSKHFFRNRYRTDAGVSADTEYPMPVSVSPYRQFRRHMRRYNSSLCL